MEILDKETGFVLHATGPPEPPRAALRRVHGKVLFDDTGPMQLAIKVKTYDPREHEFGSAYGIGMIYPTINGLGNHSVFTFIRRTPMALWALPWARELQTRAYFQEPGEYHVRKKLGQAARMGRGAGQDNPVIGPAWLPWDCQAGRSEGCLVELHAAARPWAALACTWPKRLRGHCMLRSGHV